MSRQAVQVRNVLAAPTPGKRHSALVQKAVERLQDGGGAVHHDEALAAAANHSHHKHAPTCGELARGSITFACRGQERRAPHTPAAQDPPMWLNPALEQ